MEPLASLPDALITILRDFPFPSGFDEDDVQKAVDCSEDLLILSPNIHEQYKTAVSLALLNSRLSNASAIIVVNTSSEARNIYQILTSTQKQDLEGSINNTTRSTIYRIASTFMHFKGNCYPSSFRCIIITSYNFLLRQLFYRRNNQADLKYKITLPLAGAYIFLDPLNENKMLTNINKGFSINTIDSILFLKKRSSTANKRMHYISPGFVPKEQLQKIFQTNTIIETTDINELVFDFSFESEQTLKHLKSMLPYLLLVRLYSGYPTKKELFHRIQNSILFRLLESECSNQFEKNTLEFVVKRELALTFRSFVPQDNHNYTLYDSPTLITRASQNTGRFSLTSFGKNFILASTYFKEIQNNPLAILSIIKEKIHNNYLDWDGISETFHNFTNGQIAYEDLQILINNLKTNTIPEMDSTFSALLGRNSYSIFSICKMLSCFQDYLTKETKDNLKAIRKTLLGGIPILEEFSHGKRDKLAIEQAIKEELAYTKLPVTITQLAFSLSLQKSEVKEALINIKQEGHLPLKTIIVKLPNGSKSTYFATQEIPFYFFKKCGDCYFYEKNHCTFWLKVCTIAKRKVPKKYFPYINTRNLRKETVACEIYLEASTIDYKLSLEEFYHSVPKSFIGFTAKGVEEFAHFCPVCSEKGEKVHLRALGNASFPQQGSIITRCPRCASSFKLEQKHDFISEGS